jgi:hypothetical protein
MCSSSRERSHVVLPLAWCALLGLGACGAGSGDRANSSQAALECVSIGTPAPAQDVAAVAAFRRAVEANPFFELAAAQSTPAECRVRSDEGKIELEYRFRDGSELHSSRDPSIEFTENRLQLASPLREDPVAILKRAERAAYGDKGCDIDWQTAETQRATGEGSDYEDVFYGDTCNCQARVRHDSTKRVTGLTLRSAC